MSTHNIGFHGELKYKYFFGGKMNFIRSDGVVLSFMLYYRHYIIIFRIHIICERITD